MNNTYHSFTWSLLTKIKIVSLGIFAAASLSAAVTCCPPTACATVDIELCPARFCITEEIVRAAAGLGCGRIITQCDLPLVITCPGKYSVAQDLNWAPSMAGQAGITVAISDVVIEFNGRTYKQTDSTQANCIGVLINPNLINVQLLNGTLENFSLWGIKGLGGDRELLFDHINTYSCGYNGSDSVNGTSGSGGMELLDFGSFSTKILGNPFPLNPIFDVVIRNCNFNDHYSNNSASNYFGLKPAAFFGVNQLLIQNCNFNNNAQLNSGSASGFMATVDVEACQGIRVENCNINQNSVFNGVGLINVYFNVVSDIEVRNCIANDIAFHGPSNNGFVGYGVDHGSKDVLFENCLAQNFIASGASSGMDLFFILGDSPQSPDSNVVLRGCIAQNASVADGGTSSPRGFQMQSLSNCTLEDCVAQNITGSGGQVYGFRPISNHQIIFKNCLAQGIINNTFASNTKAGGFAATFGGLTEANVIFDGCVAQDVSYTFSQFLAFGFEVQADAAFEISNCISQGNGIGIQLDTGANKGIVKNSFAINNTIWGVNDQATGGNNVLYGNYAYNPGSLRNYNGNDAGEFGLHRGTPIRTWSFIAGQQPDATTDAGNSVSDLDNINVV